MDQTKKDIIHEFFSKAGKKGGKTKGASKLRGDSDYYSRIAKLPRKPRGGKKS